MPLVNVPPNPPAPAPFPLNITPNIVSPQFQGSIVDTAVTPLASLLTHISGMSWQVDYYAQAVGYNDNLTPLQPGQLAPYQQYYLIKNYELKVSSPLSSSQDTATLIYTTTGAATMYPFMIPNEGDTFVADVGDGRLAIFTVTTVERRSILKQTCYAINYTLQSYITDALINDLTSKVVLTKYFVKDFMLYGQNPMIVDSDMNSVIWIKEALPFLLRRYLKAFYSNEFKTLIMPGQPNVCYDPYVVKTVLALFSKDDNAILGKISEVNVDGLQVWESLTIWDLLMSNDASDRDIILEQTTLIPAAAFNTWGQLTYGDNFNVSRWNGLESVFFSNIQYVVYPNLPNGSAVDSRYSGYVMPPGMAPTPLNDMTWDMISLFPNESITGGVNANNPSLPTQPQNTNPTTPPFIHPVFSDAYYVLSANFYNQSPGQSQLELLTNAMVNGQDLNLTTLLQLYESVPYWGKSEQFYYIPILLMLMKVGLRSI